MAMPDRQPSTHAPAPSPPRDIVANMHNLVPSVEPAVVFSSLARLSVPLFSDRCTINIIENGSASYRITYPAPISASAIPAADDVAGETSVRTRVESVGLMDSPGYSGVITHSWNSHQPTSTDVNQASMVARHAVTLIYLERLNGKAHHDSATIEQLRAAVLINRDIGIAMGILMTARNLSQDEAFSALHIASQQAERKMSDMAMDIIQHGTFTHSPSDRLHRPTRANRANPVGSQCRDKQYRSDGVDT